MELSSDKRRFQRIDYNKTLKFRVGTEKELSAGKIENISGGGMRLHSRRPLKEGDALSLEFTLPGNMGKVIAYASVVWAYSASSSVFETAHYAGIEFDRIPDRDREEIVEYVRRRIMSLRAKEREAQENNEVKRNYGDILVVDDDDDILEAMQMLLNDEFNVLTARDGHDALQLAMDKRPDLIILDVKLPTMDGYQVLLMLKDNEETRLIPVIMLSGLTKKAEVIQAFKEGACGYITKPFDPDRIRTKIKKVITS